MLHDLYDYLNIHLDGDSIIKPSILLEEISKSFGKDCADILRNMFLEVSLSYGLFIYDPDVEN